MCSVGRVAAGGFPVHAVTIAGQDSRSKRCARAPAATVAVVTRRSSQMLPVLALLASSALALLVLPADARADVLPSGDTVRCPPGASADPHAARCVADTCAGDCGPVAPCLPRKLCVSRPRTHGGAPVTVVHGVCTTTEDCGERGVCEELSVCVYPDDTTPRASAGPHGCGQCGASQVRGSAGGLGLAVLAVGAWVARGRRRHVAIDRSKRMR